MYSICGYIIEVIYCSIKERKLINRGFLIGPYCPIYGIGCLLINLLLSNNDNILILFCLSCLICSSLEYFSSYLLELIFNCRWWDYSKKKYNINGRICLSNCIYFGLLGTLLVKYVNPLLIDYVYKISNYYLYLFILILFIIDILFSCNIIFKFKNCFSKNRDNTKEINLIVKNMLFKK